MRVQELLQELMRGRAAPVMPEHMVRNLQNRDCPGNIRELQNAVHLYITLNAFEPDEPPPAKPDADNQPVLEVAPPPSAASLIDVMAHYEREHLLRMLNANHWHRSRVARILGIDRRTLFRKIQK